MQSPSAPRPVSSTSTTSLRARYCGRSRRAGACGRFYSEKNAGPERHDARLIKLGCNRNGDKQRTDSTRVVASLVLGRAERGMALPITDRPFVARRKGCYVIVGIRRGNWAAISSPSLSIEWLSARWMSERSRPLNPLATRGTGDIYFGRALPSVYSTVRSRKFTPAQRMPSPISYRVWVFVTGVPSAASRRVVRPQEQTASSELGPCATALLRAVIASSFRAPYQAWPSAEHVAKRMKLLLRGTNGVGDKLAVARRYPRPSGAGALAVPIRWRRIRVNEWIIRAGNLNPVAVWVEDLEKNCDGNTMQLRPAYDVVHIVCVGHQLEQINDVERPAPRTPRTACAGPSRW